jgi:hypothetical protein
MPHTPELVQETKLGLTLAWEHWKSRKVILGVDPALAWERWKNRKRVAPQMKRGYEQHPSSEASEAEGNRSPKPQASKTLEPDRVSSGDLGRGE